MLTVNLDKALKDLGTSAGGRTDYRVFMCLTEYMDENGVSTVRQSVISQETGYATRTVGNSIHRLADKGFLTVEKTAINTKGIVSNVYRIDSKYLLETKPVEQSKAGTRDRVQETQKTTPGCVNLEEALLELGSDGINEKTKKIFTVIARHANQNGEARVLLHDITSETHISAKVVKNEIGFLIHQGFLKVSKEFVNTDTAHYYRNVYTIDSRFLRHMSDACRESKPQCSACVKPYGSKTNDIQGLARLGIVMADVVKEIFAFYEERNSK